MKKIYQAPVTTLMAVSTNVTLLTSSPGTPSATIDNTGTPVDASELESRRTYSVWGDDED